VADHVSHDRISRTFGPDDLPALRTEVSDYASQSGLFGERQQDFVLAVDEVTTNAIVHGGGSGHLRLWVVDTHLWFEVADEGPGIELKTAPARPEPDQIGGRGLWLAQRLLDELVIAATADGTAVSGAMLLGD
jgi:anti-sigma regulatory factor (Ser/Thr protein kinase)